jgi:hypothetical protein
MRGLAGTSIPLSTIRRALAFSTTAELTIRGGGKPYSNLALDADRENGPAARSFAADAHDCIMVRIKRSYRIQVCDTKMCPNGELASDPQQTDRHRPDTEAMQKKPLSQFIVAPRAQASRRCETQATLSGKAAKLCYRFGPLTPSARSANLIAGDGTWRNRRSSAAYQASR